MWAKCWRETLSTNSNYFVCDVYIPLLHWLHDSADCLEVHAFYINQVSNLLNKLMQFQSNCSSVFGKAKANNDLSECYRFFICMHILYLRLVRLQSEYQKACHWRSLHSYFFNSLIECCIERKFSTTEMADRIQIKYSCDLCNIGVTRLGREISINCCRCTRPMKVVRVLKVTYF